jgi:hypothetical protein
MLPSDVVQADSALPNQFHVIFDDTDQEIENEQDEDEFDEPILEEDEEDEDL